MLRKRGNQKRGGGGLSHAMLRSVECKHRRIGARDEEAMTTAGICTWASTKTNTLRIVREFYRYVASGNSLTSRVKPDTAGAVHSRASSRAGRVQKWNQAALSPMIHSCCAHVVAKRNVQETGANLYHKLFPVTLLLIWQVDIPAYRGGGVSSHRPQRGACKRRVRFTFIFHRPRV